MEMKRKEPAETKTRHQYLLADSASGTKGKLKSSKVQEFGRSSEEGEEEVLPQNSRLFSGAGCSEQSEGNFLDFHTQRRLSKQQKPKKKEDVSAKEKKRDFKDQRKKKT